MSCSTPASLPLCRFLPPHLCRSFPEQVVGPAAAAGPWPQAPSQAPCPCTGHEPTHPGALCPAPSAMAAQQRLAQPIASWSGCSWRSLQRCAPLRRAHRPEASAAPAVALQPRGLCWSQTACGLWACLSQKHWDQGGFTDLMVTGASCLTGRQADVCKCSAHAWLLWGSEASVVTPWLAVHVLLLMGDHAGFEGNSSAFTGKHGASWAASGMSQQVCMASCCSAAEAGIGMQSPCNHDRGDSFSWVVCTMLGCRALVVATKAPLRALCGPELAPRALAALSKPLLSAPERLTWAASVPALHLMWLLTHPSVLLRRCVRRHVQVC